MPRAADRAGKRASGRARFRQKRKQAEADRAYWLARGGESAWRAELTRRQLVRTARVRERTAAVLAERARDQQLDLWGAA